MKIYKGPGAEGIGHYSTLLSIRAGVVKALREERHSGAFENFGK
jgi:hypothetical protein